MAEVYLAEDERLQRRVAVKVLPAAFAAEGTFRARFEREARAAARLQHPHILAVYDFGQQDDTTYLVMPFMNGGSLAQVIARARGPLPTEKLVQWTAEIGSALKYAHDQGIIHRDVKPGNMLLGPQEHLLLADFGIAKVVDETTALTHTGTGVGSPEYMAPEQATGKADYRSDIYALGVVIFQMLTGRVPFTAHTPVQVIMQHVKAPPPSPRTLNPSLSPQVEAVVLRALAKAPEQRFQSATELADALKVALAGRPATPPVAVQADDLSTRMAPPEAVRPGTPPRIVDPLETRRAAAPAQANVAALSPVPAQPVAPAGVPTAHPATRSRPRDPMAVARPAAPQATTIYQSPANLPAAYVPQQPASWQQSAPAPQEAYAAPVPRRKRGTRLLLVLLILLLLIALALGGAIAYVLTHPGFMPFGQGTPGVGLTALASRAVLQ
jgi:hypothetical protein